MVKELRDVGSIILGKTNMDEFAMGSSTESSAYQKTKNPRDTDQCVLADHPVIGGGGCGRVCCFALGPIRADLSDSRHAVRYRPKPTHGRVSRWADCYGVESRSNGPLTQSVEDG